MNLRLAAFAAVFATISFSCAMKPEAREWTAKDGTVVKYRFAAPEVIEPGKSYPLVLFLHGAGERGDDNEAQLKHGVTAILEGAKKLNQPIFLIAPQCPKERYWSPIDETVTKLTEADKPNALLEAVVALTEETSRTHPVDIKRFYVTGISMGGFATWDLLGRIPERIAAAIPVCGGGHVPLVEKYKEVPIWAFHGERDETVPTSATREIITALQKKNATPKVTYYPTAKHDSWTQTYKDLEVIRWLLDQHKD